MKKRSDLLTAFREYISANKLFHPKDQLLLAVSGGIDSVVLCDLCHRAGFAFMIAHCNFRLRGAESIRDENFVRLIADKYQVKVEVAAFDTETYAMQHRQSIQVAARELRYRWFRELTQAGGNAHIIEPVPQQDARYDVEQTEIRVFRPRFILTAHHADDNIETVMMNFFKGTGIAGLRGILPAQDNIIRPLLFAWKEDLVRYASEHQLDFVEDSSNASEKYTRNYFRNQLIPALEKFYPAVKENLRTGISRFRDTELLYEEMVEWHKKKLLEGSGSQLRIAVLKLKKIPGYPTVLYEVLKPFGFSAHQSAEVIKLLDSESGKYVQSSTHRVIRNRKWLVITGIDTRNTEISVVEADTKKLEFVAGTLNFKTVPADQFQLSSAPNEAALDATGLRFPLILRRWKQGDYFYPLGLRKKKKVSRFLIDQKVSLPDKENTWVLESDKKIIWVVNRRIDDRFKVTGNTKQIILMEFSPTGS